MSLDLGRKFLLIPVIIVDTGYFQELAPCSHYDFVSELIPHFVQNPADYFSSHCVIFFVQTNGLCLPPIFCRTEYLK